MHMRLHMKQHSLYPSFSLLSLPPLQFQLARDYSSDDRSFTVKKGDVVEVLDNKIEEKWFIRTLSSNPTAAWIPSSVLEPIGKEDTDGKSRTTITSGKLSSLVWLLYTVTPSHMEILWLRLSLPPIH